MTTQEQITGLIEKWQSTLESRRKLGLGTVFLIEFISDLQQLHPQAELCTCDPRINAPNEANWCFDCGKQRWVETDKTIRPPVNDEELSARCIEVAEKLYYSSQEDKAGVDISKGAEMIMKLIQQSPRQGIYKELLKQVFNAGRQQVIKNTFDYDSVDDYLKQQPELSSPQPMSELQKLMDDIRQWSDKTFPNSTELSKIEHLKKEVDELRDAIFHEHSKTEIAMEFADCIILILNSASHYLQGIN